MRSSGVSTRLIIGLLERLLGKATSMIAPWIISFIICPIFSIIFYLLWHKYYDYVTIGFIFVGSCLTYLAYKLSHNRRFMGRWHGTATMASTMGWLYFATLNGPFSRPTFDIGFGMAIFISMTWTMRGAIRNESSESKDIVKWPDAADDLGLPGSRWRTLKTSNNKKLSGIIKVAPGKQSFDDVKNKRGLIASLFGAPENGVRITKTDNHAEARVDIVREDFLKHEILWVPSQFGGMSIADGPIRIGHYEDDEIAEFNFYSEHGARHLMISGMNGSGKSVAARVILADLFSRKDVEVYAIDVVKGRQTLYAAESGLKEFITDKTEATIFMNDLTGMIRDRADFLGEHGFDSWKPEVYTEHGMPFIVILIEEAPAVVRNAAIFTRIVEQARSAGISIIASIQRASYTNMPTDARAQLGTVLCFGVRDIQDARFALSNETVERGADPSLWQQRKPGYAYLQSPEIDEEKTVIPLRVYNITTSQLSDSAGLVSEKLTAPSGAQTTRKTPNEAKEKLTEYIEQLDKEEFTPKDLYPILAGVGRKRPWIHTELNRRMKEGSLLYIGNSTYKVSN